VGILSSSDVARLVSGRRILTGHPRAAA
jgi:hypothetical protein